VKKRTSSKVAGTTRDYHPFPKYLQIRDVILRWLATQQVGERLPTEMALSDQFGVSRETIRKSLTRLEQNGIIRRRQRAGTFLAKRPAMNADLRLTGPIEEFKDLGTATTAKLVSQQAVRARADVAGALGLVEGDQVYEFKRIRVLGGEPLLLLDAYFPPAIGRKIARVDLHGNLVVPTLRKILRSPLQEEYQQIDAVVARGVLARQLRVTPGAPVLTVKRLFVDSRGNPAVFFREHFRSDRYFYTIKLPQGRRR
jgi:GntR family transcriptional regulator